jgi:hypothetical protein
VWPKPGHPVLAESILEPSWQDTSGINQVSLAASMYRWHSVPWGPVTVPSRGAGNRMALPRLSPTFTLSRARQMVISAMQAAHHGYLLRQARAEAEEEALIAAAHVPDAAPAGYTPLPVKRPNKDDGEDEGGSGTKATRTPLATLAGPQQPIAVVGGGVGGSRSGSAPPSTGGGLTGLVKASAAMTPAAAASGGQKRAAIAPPVPLNNPFARKPVKQTKL